MGKSKYTSKVIAMQGDGIHQVQTGNGETIEQMCARLSGNGPTQTSLKDSAKPPSIKAPNSGAGGVSVVIGSIVVLIILALLAYGACRWLELL